MPVHQDKPAPYAPTSAIMDIIMRHRTKGLPSPVDADVLGRAGISDSLISRTLQALETLDLIDENGAPTKVFEGIRLAPEADFKVKLDEWLRSAYADALLFVDPETADDTSIRDAFRGYKPIGQQPRMVTLFTGLFAAAGVRPEKQETKPRKPRAESSPRQTKRTPRKPSAGQTSKQDQSSFSGNLPPALAGLLASLPDEGGTWTQNDRDAFVTTFEAVLNFCYKVAENEGEEEIADSA
ncbi:MAG: hypothetical protein EP340_05205 [Alphaproteobacteria bacterium]|nr:MAG: hypothetical protein EP340_05205 [Alphaproteobacteria bacterium]